MRWLSVLVLAAFSLTTLLLWQRAPAPLPGATASAPEAQERGVSAGAVRVASRPQQRVSESAPVAREGLAALWDRPAPILRATLTDPEGRPLRQRYVAFELRLAEDTETFDLMTTDAEGTFTWRVGSRTALVEPARSVGFTIAPWSATALTIEVPLLRPLRSGFDDLGVLRLAQPPVVVAGVVVDEQGRPHPGAVVELLAPAADPTHGGVERARDARAWETLWPPVRTTSDADGRFAFRAAWSGTEVALRAHPREAPSGGLFPFTCGETNARLVVPQGAALQGTCLLDDPSSAKDVVIVVEGGAPGAPTELERVTPAPDGRFRAARLAAGRVAVVATHQGRLVARIEALTLVAGTTTRDPRLESIDLRTGAVPLSVRVVDRLGRPIFCARARALRSGEVVAEATTDREGRARFVVPALPVELWIDDPASRLDVTYRPRLVRPVAADTEVALEDGPRVRLVVEGEASLPAELRLRFMLERRTESLPAGAPPPEGGPFAFHAQRYGGAEAAAPFFVPGPGSYAPFCVLQRADGKTTEFYVEPRLLEVTDARELQVLEVRLPAPALAAAIAALRAGK